MMSAPPRGRGCNSQLNMTALGKLKRVRQKILEDLIKPLRIGADRRRQRFVDVDLESEVLVFRDRPERPLEILLHLVEPNFDDVERDGPGFHFGEVENVVD